MENNNDEIKKKAEELTSKIKTSEEELKELRKKCKHLEYEIKNSNTDGGTTVLKRFCLMCKEEIGFPSTEDLEKNGYK